MVTKVNNTVLDLENPSIDAIDMGGNVITNHGTPTGANDVATKFYVDNFGVGGAKLPLAGGTMAGQINMDGNTITNLPIPGFDGDAASKLYVDGFLSLGGGLMIGNINMDGNFVFGLPTPTGPDEAATKGYVDGVVGSSTWTYTAQVTTLAGTTVVLMNNVSMAGVTDIEILFNEISMSLINNSFEVRVGPASGVVGAGYSCAVNNLQSNFTAETTTGFLAGAPGTTFPNNAHTGMMRLRRWDTSENLWIMDSSVYGDTVTGLNLYMATGFIDLGGSELNDISLVSPLGVATFDAGEARIRYR